ncbi:Uncharacterized protein APZ42_011622 [Daphnia magna]|uniref:Uncharacterized protein n=1 Tax=Daphnia magna TaxID=35525 RepID=A0A162SV60_9CRUS|nr:Uncharacterized protein APZ42_011622 [Daphnia magna]
MIWLLTCSSSTVRYTGQLLCTSSSRPDFLFFFSLPKKIQVNWKPIDLPCRVEKARFCQSN